jgi:hypothetical protein
VTDEVAIFDSGLRQILQSARPLRANVKESSKLPEHTLENGFVINDHKILNPAEVEITFFLDAVEYKNIYQVVRQIFRSGQSVIVQTRTHSYSSMNILELPHEETPDIADSVVLTIKFKELRLTTAQFGVLPPSSVQNISQSSTRDRGEQQPKKSSALFDLFKK